MNYEQDLIEFINRELLDGQGDDLDALTPLLELRLIDSVSIVMLSGYISEKHGVEVPVEHLIPENLQDVQSIAKMIETLRHQYPGSDT